MTVLQNESEDGSPDFTALRLALKDRRYEVRKAAVERLDDIGDERAVELLCRALRDETSGIPIAAARALTRIGNPAAIPALTRALRSHRIIRAPRRQRAAGALLLFLGLLFGFGPALLPRSLLGGDLCLAGCLMASLLCFCIRSTLAISSDVHRAVAQALADLATRSRALAAREALADLRALESDLFAEDRRSRKAYRRAANAIEAATAPRRDLPLTADAAPRAGALPIPGCDRAPEGDGLPRPAEAEA